MLKNYFKIALRHLMRHKSYTIINTVGLGVGLAACIIIGLWVYYEFSYDRYHENADRVYRVLSGSSAATQAPLAAALNADHPDLVKETVRFWPIPAPADIVYEDKIFVEHHITFSDPSIFRVFTHPMVLGNPETALADPSSIVLSETTAEKFFGKENPLGKTMNMWGRDLQVTGVFRDVPFNSHHRFDILVPLELLRSFMGSMLDNWSWNGFYTYVLPTENTGQAQIEAALPPLYAKYAGNDFPEASLQPLTDIYFAPADKDIGVTSGNIMYVYILTTIAVFVLVVACVNFMNLSTAYSALRTKEVGMRKTLGAHRRQLIGQFLGEAVLLSLLALAVAMTLVELMLPFFSNFTGKPLAMPFGYNGITIAGLLGFALLMGIIAGSYPAFFLSGFRPVHAFKDESLNGASGILLRKGLVVFQFVISTFLIIAAITVFTQLRFMQNKSLGFDEEEIVVLEAGNYQLLKEELSKIPGVAGVSAAYNVPGQRFPYYPFRTEEMAADSLPVMRTLRVNEGFIETMGMKMVMGRSFDEHRPADETSAFVINRAAAAYLGWENPLGQKIDWYDFSEDGTTFEVAKKGQVIGVVEDFNYASLHNPIEPLIMHVSRDINWAVLRLRPENASETISQIREVRNGISQSPFAYYFLDQELDQQYGAEEKLGQLFGGLTALALFIACLGLFGLTAFTTSQRTKEIGIRKVMGASVANIVTLLSKDFVKLVIIGFVIAVPIAWYAMSRWLEDFAYRIQIGPELFILAGLAVVVIALATVSWQSVKAALANPVKSLRSD